MTGASGFIGGRVCERLVQIGARHVTALIHNPSHAVRIARLPIRMCSGDLLDRKSLRNLVGEARIVIHLGIGYGGAIVKGTRNILEASLHSRVHRFVHMSTAAVYGLKPNPRRITEDAPLRCTGNVYCDSKMRAERLVARFHREGLPVVTLRPSIVYGPYSRWCTRLIQALGHGTGILIDGGTGVCNTTFVDNLVDSIFLSIERQEAIGESLFVTDGEHVTWADFIGAHAAMITPRPILANISSAEIIEQYKSRPGLWRSSWIELRRLLYSREFRGMAKQIPLFDSLFQRLWYYFQSLTEQQRERLRMRIEGSKSSKQNTRIHRQSNPDLDTLAIQTGTVLFSIDKARRILGYEPRVRFSEGMRLTERWLRFANYL